MSKFKEHYREAQYRPQAAKSLRNRLYSFIKQEFPRLGGSWVIWTFVDKLLEIVDSYRFYRGKLKPGQMPCTCQSRTSALVSSGRRRTPHLS
jgi:hypothetical protein